MPAKPKAWLYEQSPGGDQEPAFGFDGRVITVEETSGSKTCLTVEDIREIGVETTDTGPFLEDVFWLINRDTVALRIPQNSPVFKSLLDRFGTFAGFDWQSFTEAMSCADNRYFLCWKRARQAAAIGTSGNPGST